MTLPSGRTEMFQKRRPTLQILSEEAVAQIVAEALSVLKKTGVFVESRQARSLLFQAGVAVDEGRKRAYIREDVVEKCLQTAPRRIKIYDRDGRPAMDLQGLDSHFDPGSAAIHILDSDTGEIRKPCTDDLVNFARLTDALDHFRAQSTGLVPADVPQQIGDRYRLFIALQHCAKPVVTGTFAVEGFEVMKEMLVAVRGDERRLRERPLAIFDCCPSPPLRWNNLTCQSLLDCARSGIPAELVSMPLSGATAPFTLAGSLVQHTAENLSGVVIHQLANPGAPLIYGGSPAIFDMRRGTTPMGAIETMMIDAAYAQIGRHLGLPTHAYMGLSDAKVLDYQAGLESAIGAVMAVLAGINVISGGGMLDFESCQSLEKLVIDNDICGMALRLAQGIDQKGEKLAADLYGDIDGGDHFLTSPETLKWLRSEPFIPSDIIDRSNRDEWIKGGARSAEVRAREQVRLILAKHGPEPLVEPVTQELRKIMEQDARRYGLDRLP
ncbi:MAG: trimethylamine methyltransferase family protein [bacterium]